MFRRAPAASFALALTGIAGFAHAADAAAPKRAFTVTDLYRLKGVEGPPSRRTARASSTSSPRPTFRR